jgi:hypothetical protein
MAGMMLLATELGASSMAGIVAGAGRSTSRATSAGLGMGGLEATSSCNRAALPWLGGASPTSAMGGLAASASKRALPWLGCRVWSLRNVMGKSSLGAAPPPAKARCSSCITPVALHIHEVYI